MFTRAVKLSKQNYGKVVLYKLKKGVNISSKIESTMKTIQISKLILSQTNELFKKVEIFKNTKKN